MNEVIDAFRRVIPNRYKRTGRGWITFDCPACGDRRGRGGFLETPTGGFRYRCQNGGCDYEKRTGWEPEGGLFGRPRRLFQILGGDISDIPEKWLKSDPNPVKLSRAEWVKWMMSDTSSKRPVLRRPEDLNTLTDFPEVTLPQDCQLLWQATSKNARDAQDYVLNRSSLLAGHPFCWSPKYPRHVIVPFVCRNKLVGWIARKIDEGKEYAHIKCPNWPTHYMYNQQLVWRRPTVLVQEGTFDAILMGSLCTFGNTITDKQVNLLNSCGKKIILLPDFKKDEWWAYWQTAKDNNWYLAIPEYPGDDGHSGIDHIKDAGESISRNGLLYTMRTVMGSLTQDYLHAETIYGMRSRS
jgi:hypothetical protein